MKILFMLLISLTVLQTGAAQIVTVIDNESQAPLEHVIIISDKKSTTVITNTEGQADITAMKDATVVEFVLLGYESLRKSYTEIADQSFVIELTRGGISLDQIVVAASKWSQESRDVPVKITSLTQRDITLQNPQTAADLLGSSGEVFIQKSQQGGGSPMIRGFSTNRLLYVVDGVRMNTAIFRSGNLQNVISLDPFATEKAEVLFGPGSVIYGSDAIGGVMSFTTLTPKLSLQDNTFVKGSAIARYSSANKEQTAHFDVNVGWKKWALLTSISTNDFGDLRMGSFGPEEYLRPFYVQRQDSVDRVITNHDPQLQVPTGYTQMNLMQKVLFSPNEKWNFQYGFHYSATSSYSRYDRHIRYRNGLPRYGEWEYGPQIWMMNNLRINHNDHNDVYDQMLLNAAFQNFQESRIDRNINDPQRHIREEEVDAFSLNLDFVKSVGESNKLYYGVEGVWDDVTSTGIDENISTGISIDGPARYPQATWNSYAAYVNYLMHLNDKMALQGGVRYNVFDLQAEFDATFYPFPYTTASISNGALTGSLGLTFHPSHDLILSANISTGFRSPNVDDAGKVFDSEPGAVIIPNPDLKAEYAYNAEVGAAKVFGKNVKVDLTGYYTRLDNALVRRKFTLNGQDSIIYDGELSQVQAIQNAAVATVYGLQAGVEIKLPSGFGVSSDFNYQVGEEELDDGTTSPSRHAAPFFGITRLSYTEEKVNLTLYVQYSGEKEYEDLPLEERGKTEIYAVDENGDPFSPGWVTLNFKAMVLIEKHLSITAGVENITDRRYRPYSSGVVAAGRNVILSAKFTF